MKNCIFVLCLFFLPISGTYSQCVPDSANCNAATSSITPTTDNVSFIFDTFSKYNGGIYQYGHTILKLKVDSNSTPSRCRWKLSMIVSNNGWINTDQWYTQATYGDGSSGINPTLDLLEIRVTNTCSTPINNGVWQRFNIPPGNGDLIDIINEPINPITPAGSCSSQVNGAGSYLGHNYGEYSFTIDYRIKPGLNWIPGYYNLNVKFCLTE